MASSSPTKVVVVAFDASTQAEHALDYYIHHIHQESTKLLLVHVVDLPDSPHSRRHVLDEHYSLVELWGVRQNEAKVLGDKVMHWAKARGIKDAQILIKNGLNPGEMICKAAASRNALMIVIGTRGMGTVRRTIMGSVSDYVLHHAHCAVMICRQGEQTEER